MVVHMSLAEMLLFAILVWCVRVPERRMIVLVRFAHLWPLFSLRPRTWRCGEQFLIAFVTPP